VLVHPVGDGDQHILIGGEALEDGEEAIQHEHHVGRPVAVDIADARAARIRQRDRVPEQRLKGNLASMGVNVGPSGAPVAWSTNQRGSALSTFGHTPPAIGIRRSVR
jgi:hypothetical protein